MTPAHAKKTQTLMAITLWHLRAFLLAAVGVLLPVGVWAAGPFSFYPLSPCRIIDIRNPADPTGGPKLSANTQRDFPILSLCGVPSTAKAASLNVMVSQPTDFGDPRIWPAGDPTPLASVINWVTTDFAVASGAINPLGVGVNNVSVFCDMPPGSTGQVHLITDVTGSFQ
jgi:hypothetical protein